MEGVLNAMLVTNLKIATVVLMVVATVGIGGGVLSRSTPAAAQSAAKQKGDQSSPEATGNRRTTAAKIEPTKSEGGEEPELPKTDMDRMQGIGEVVSLERGWKEAMIQR